MTAKKSVESASYFRMLQRVGQGRLDVAQLAAAVVTDSVEPVGEHLLVAQQALNRIGQLNLSAGAVLHLRQVIEAPAQLAGAVMWRQHQPGRLAHPLRARTHDLRQPRRSAPVLRARGRAIRFCVRFTEDLPAAEESTVALGGHLEGCRIGFDLGASDRKVSAVIDGEPVFTEEVPWDPRAATDPQYHFDELMKAFRAAAAHMPRVDAIGGSAAGVYIGNRPREAFEVRRARLVPTLAAALAMPSVALAQALCDRLWGGPGEPKVEPRGLWRAPLIESARAQIERTRIAALLKGYRGRPAADINAVVNVLVIGSGVAAVSRHREPEGRPSRRGKRSIAS